MKTYIVTCAIEGCNWRLKTAEAQIQSVCAIHAQVKHHCDFRAYTEVDLNRMKQHKIDSNLPTPEQFRAYDAWNEQHIPRGSDHAS